MKKEPDPSRYRWGYRAMQFLVRLVFRMAFRVRAEGIEHIPRTGGVLIACNHASVIDPMAIGAVVPRESFFFAKKELFSVPVISQFISYLNSIPVDRQGDSSAALKIMIQKLGEGWSTIVFPEGTRTRTGEFGEPKRGAGMAAVTSGVPVVPCWIEGTFRVRTFRSRVTLHFMEPFHPEDIRAESKRDHYSLVSERIMSDIKRLRQSQMALRNEAKF
jgi:1-acyl-sn-glycerol-3-phosphate acyltransferase